MRVGIDIDGVLCRTIDYFIFEFNKEHDAKFNRDSIKEVDFPSFEGYEPDYVLKKMVEHIDNNMHYYDIFEFSKSSLKQLKGQGFELYVITARMMHFKQTTLDWLNTHFGEDFFDEIIFYNHDLNERICKSEICAQNNVKVLIDDSPKNALNCLEKGIPVLLMSHPWNEHMEESDMLKRVSGWKDVVFHLENSNILKKEIKIDN